MLKCCAAKRTGVYRVCGNMADFQLELKLRHISEWLPVPKFEYCGANAANHAEKNYLESTGSSSWTDFCIYVPYDDQNGNNYCNYYNYYNPSSGYPSGKQSNASSKSHASNGNGSGATQSTVRSVQQEEQQRFPLHTTESFAALNRELCNGGTANLCIGWQQKHFSRAELQRYGDASACVTALHRRYHRWALEIQDLQERHHQVQAASEGAEQKQRARRNRKPKRKSTTMAVAEYDVETAAAAEQQSKLKSKLKPQVPPLPEDPNFAARTCLIHTLIDADLDELESSLLPPEASELRRQGYQLMYVYAQLQKDTLLLSLRYSPTDGLLYVYPDFNISADDLDYVLEIDNDCRQLYAYGFQNVSQLEQQQLEPEQDSAQEEEDDNQSLAASDASAEQLVTFYQQQRARTTELRRLLQFTMPPKRMRRVTLLLQLHQAQSFEYPNIHIRYYVNPPGHTLLEPTNRDDPFPLRGATASCQMSGVQRIACFSHCWQLTLLCEESYEPHQLLNIYFEIVSIDSWQRERCEGYAYYSCSLLAPLPASVIAGIQLHCIRPVGNWMDALNRYFIGGRSLFDFVGYFNGSSREHPSLHSRLERVQAQAMRSTGTILFSMQKLQQRQHQLSDNLTTEDSDDYDGDRYRQRVKDTQTMASTTLDEVLVAYLEARERVELLLGHTASL